MIPQIIYLILLIIGIYGGICRHGKPQENYNFTHVLLGIFIQFLILLAGGFFKPLFR